MLGNPLGEFAKKIDESFPALIVLARLAASGES
jgi:hypothetical protein